MFQRDYILRIIEQMSQMIGQVVFKLKQERKFEEALEELDGMLHRLSLPEGNILRTISVDDMMQMLEKDGQSEIDKIGAIATILKEQADIYEQLGDEDTAWSAAVKSLHYHLICHRLSGSPEPSSDIDSLYESLKAYVLQPMINVETALYYERVRQYDSAENVWYELCETNEPVLLEQAKLFYERILTRDDDELEQAGLPRSEAVDGLEDVLSRSASIE